MTEIISHPGKPLITHLREVARFSQYAIECKKFNLDIQQDVLGKLGFIQGALHDIGKATSNFQEYIKSKGKIIKQPKHHALISAFIAKRVSQQYLNSIDIDELSKKIIPYFIFTSVKRHHGNVKNFTDELETLREKKDDLKILVNNFHEKEVVIIINELLAEVGLQYDWKEFKRYMNDLNNVFYEFDDFSIDIIERRFKKLENAKKIEYFYLHHILFSSLLLADKSDVKLGENKGSRVHFLNNEAVSDYRNKKGWNKKPKKKLDQLKNEAYFQGLQNVDKKFKPNQHLYSITLPTGMGKTITSLALALKIKKLLRKQNPRIIITIPFTSIIDQNYEVFNDIFFNASSDILLKHHHLAEPTYKTSQEDEVKNAEISQFLIETWQSEIIVTTFVQLLESIFTNRKNKLLKLTNLTNSIILLDEVQQINHEYWELIRASFKTLAEKYNCYFILMSATQPLIFEPDKEIIELIPNYKKYFNFFNRTKIVNKTNQIISLDEFCAEIVNHHEKNPTKDILVILNTRQSTLECFKKVSESIHKDNANLFFLTTLITPFERKKIINKIKNKKSITPNIIISTQLIEAGVDISVHTVFRALAPMDSIIQAAGRANRYGESKQESNIYVYKISEIEKATNMLYGPTLIAKTLKVLSKIKSINEKHYINLIEAYFKEVKIQTENMTSKELHDLMLLNFENIGKFNFIKYRKTESVFIQLTQRAKNIWEKYTEIYNSQELSIFEKKEKFSLIKSEFYDYVINVPVPWNKEHIVFDSEPEHHFYVSKLDAPSICYHYDPSDFRKNIGYVENEKTTLNY